MAMVTSRVRPLLFSLVLLLTVAAVAFASDAQAQSVPFGKTSLQGANVVNPTSLQFGPDGRLYVAQKDGLIKVLTVQQDGAFNYSVTASEVISLVQQIPNHDDDGTPNPSITERLITGILVVGTASEPVLYVSSSDPRIAIEEDTNLDTNSGIISRLTWTGAQWEKQDLVRGLPRNEENHSPNGMALDGSTLYLAQGGHTNMGAPSNSFAYQPEYALSGAILSIDLSTIGTTTYDLPTLDDPTRANVGAEDDGDPFGGNDGLNQAKLVVGGPVQVYSPGYRNAFDLVITTTPGREGRMYTIDNGPNNNWGGPPINEGPTGNCTAEPNELGTNSYNDNLHFVTGPGYYGGHPNPMRGNPGGAGLYDEAGNPLPLPSDWPAVPLSEANPVECDYRVPGVEDGSLSQWTFSTNGMTEYTATTFEGDLQGDLLAAGYNNTIQRVQLNQAGDAATSTTTLFSNVGDLPLDVTAQGDADPFPGTIWVADFTAAGGQVYVFEPASGSCDLSDPTADADGDGYTNEDELDNGVDPCSGADVPPDRDGDFTSDINDADDDNDGTPDVTDAFALDDQDGLTTTMPIDYTWFGGAPGFGFFNLGFTGLMYNGSTEYLTLYDPTNITAGGAAGKFTIDKVPSGDAVANSQQYGFQFGVNVQGVTESFTAHTSIQAPFSGIQPQDFQSMGLFIGTGDQDNYVKVVTTAKQGGRVEIGGEINGSTFSFNADAPIIGSTNTQLYITVEPSTATVQASYSVNGGARYPFGDPVAIPRSWFDGTDALAVGLLSTSSGPGPEFTATWEYISVEPTTDLAPEGLWTQVPSFNDATARHENGFVFGGRFFYLLGGRGTRPVELYDPEKDEWTFLSNAPTEMHHFQAVEHDGLIYVVAGLQGGGANETGLSNIYIFDPVSKTWSVGPEIPEARRRGSTGVVVYQDKFYIVGGLTGAHGEAGTAFAYFDEFDPATNTWNVLPDAPRVRDHFHSVLVEDEMYLIGGRNSGVSGFLNATIPEIDVYNFTTGQWQTLPASQNIPLPRAAAATGRFEDDIILSGGEGPSGPYLSTEAYNLNSQTWRTLQDALTPRHGTQAIVHKNGFYVAAGSDVLGGGGEAGANVLEALYMGDPEQPSGSAIKAGPLNVPSGVAFGTVSVGSASTQSVTLTNGGNEQGIVIEALTVGSDPAAPGGEAAFSVASPHSLPVVLRPGASLTVDVTFSPTEGGTKQALLNVQRSGESSPVAIPLSGTGAADLTATPGSLNFGTVEVGTTSTSQKVVVANESGASLSVTGVSTASPFVITSAPSFPVTLAAGASLNVNVAFAPTSAGTQTGTLSITSDTGSSLAVALSGEGALSSTDGLLAEYDFVPDANPQVLVDRSGQGRNGQLGSTSDSDANDPAWTDVGLQFDGTNDYAELGDLFDITETQDQTILIYLRPDTQHLGDLFVKRNASDAAFYYLRQNTDGLRVQYRDATGTDAVNVSPFSGAIGGGAFVMASIRLDNGTNLSTGLHTAAGSQYVSEAVVPSRSFENSASARFGALVQFGQIFNAFDGTMAYARIYNRVLTTSELDLAYNEITQIIDGRTGDPSAPTLSASPTSVDFGTVEVGTSTTASSVTLANGGTSALTVSALGLSGTHAGDFTLSGLPTLPLTLQAGETTSVDVTFSPSSSGTRTAQVDVTYDQPASPLAVALTGEGLEGQTGGLLAEYDFVPGTDPQVLVDRSGQGNDGVLGSSSSSDTNDPSWGTAGLVFDGANDFVDLGDRFDVTETDDQTVLLFFLPETAHLGDLWVKRTGSDPAFGFVRLNTDGLRLQYRDATGTDAANFSPFSGQIAPGAYVMASMRLDNGVALTAGLHTAAGSQYAASDVTPARSFANSATTKLGALQQFGQVFNAFDGTMAYARIYNRVLTTAELDQAYAEIAQIVDGRTGDPSAPTLSASPSSVDFGTVDVGTSTAATSVTLANGGTSALTVDAIGLSGTNAGDFTLTGLPALPLTLQAGETTSVDVTFGPSSVGTKTAQIGVTYDQPASPLTVALQGTGQDGTPSDPLTPIARYDFQVDGDQTLLDLEGTGPDGQLGASPGADGSDPAWTADGLAFDGTDDYVTFGDAFDIGPADDLSFAIQFRVNTTSGGHDLFVKRNPDTAFYYLRMLNGALRFQARTTAGIDVVDFSAGTVIAGQVHVAHVVLDNAAGTVRIGLDGQDVGTASFPAGSDFSGSAQATLGALVNGALTFNDLDGTLLHARFFDAALTPAEMEQVAADIASGVPLAATPTSLDFGTVEIGQTAGPLTVSIGNQGTETVEVSSLDVTAPFALVSSPALPFSLSAGASFSVDVEFAPTQAGTQAGELAVATTASGTLSVPLTGTATQSLADGLLAEYDFVPGADLQVLVDRSGQGNDGVLGSSPSADANDPVWGTAGLVFDGLNDFVDLGDRFDVTEADDQTVLLFFLPDTAHKGDLWVKRTSSDPAFTFIRFDTDDLRLQYRDVSGTDVVNFTAFGGQLTTGAYAMASMRLDNGVDLTAGLHTDGGSQYDARTVTPARSFANTATTKLGALQQFGQVFNAFDGTMAYARVYNRVLTTAELDQAYAEIRQIVDTRTGGSASFLTASVAFQTVDARMNANRVQVAWDVSGYAANMTFEVDRQVVTGGVTAPWMRLAQVDGTVQAGKQAAAKRAAMKTAQQASGDTTTAPRHVFTDAGAPDADRLQYRIRALDPNGEVATSKVVTIDRTPDRFAVLGAYPSPMRGRGTLALEIPEPDRVEVRLYDVLGRQVAHIVDAELPAGRHRIPLVLDGFASGVYFGRVAYAGNVRTVRIVLVQ